MLRPWTTKSKAQAGIRRGRAPEPRISLPPGCAGERAPGSAACACRLRSPAGRAARRRAAAPAAGAAAGCRGPGISAVPPVRRWPACAPPGGCAASRSSSCSVDFDAERRCGGATTASRQAQPYRTSASGPHEDRLEECRDATLPVRMCSDTGKQATEPVREHVTPCLAQHLSSHAVGHDRRQLRWQPPTCGRHPPCVRLHDCRCCDHAGRGSTRCRRGPDGVDVMQCVSRPERANHALALEGPCGSDLDKSQFGAQCGEQAPPNCEATHDRNRPDALQSLCCCF